MCGRSADDGTWKRSVLAKVLRNQGREVLHGRTFAAGGPRGEERACQLYTRGDEFQVFWVTEEGMCHTEGARFTSELPVLVTIPPDGMTWGCQPTLEGGGGIDGGMRLMHVLSVGCSQTYNIATICLFIW